jgi:hypothetical protein
MAIVNFSSSTPAAPSGNTNVTFQVDGSNDISAYIQTPAFIASNNVFTGSTNTFNGISASSASFTTPLPVSSGGSGLSSTSQNFVFAGPTSGSGAPTFRALTSADISTKQVNVRDYGATGNGSTDDTTAINAAIAACPVGGQVIFPAGTYLTASGLTITKAVSLIGQGAGGLNQGSGGSFNTFSAATTITTSSTSASTVTYSTTGSTWLSDVTIRDIAIQGNRYVTSATAGDCLKIDGGANAIRHLHLDNVLLYWGFTNWLIALLATVSRSQARPLDNKYLR